MGYLNRLKINNGLKFLILVLVLFVVVAATDFNNARLVLLYFIEMNKKILPLLGVVFVAMIFVNVFLTEEKIKKHLSGEKGIKGFFYASLAGILISGPPFVLFPMLGELKKKGLTDYHLAIFLYNSNVKIPFLPALVLYFGISFSIIFSFYIILFSLFNGILLSFLLKERKLLNRNHS